MRWLFENNILKNLMIKKISTVLILVTFGTILSITHISIVNATSLTIDANNVENLVEITDIIEKETLKSIDFSQFDSRYNRSKFLWSPDGSKLLILTKMYIWTKNASLNDVNSVRCGESDIHERASTLFWIDANGTESTNIARTEESIRTARNNTANWLESAWWNSDGDKIVFEVLNPCDEKPFNLYVSDRNGSILAKVNSLWSPFMQWSPDKSKIAIVDGKNNTQIYVIDVGNSTVKQLPLGNSASMYSIKWNPDRNKIAFVGYKNGEIYTVNADNHSVQQLTTDMQARELSWKPDGEKIVFVAEDGIYVIYAGGGDPTLIEKGNFVLGSWSPDGKKIILKRNNEKGDFDMFHVLAIDETTTKLTAAAPDLGSYLEFVLWSHDGRKILFRGTDEKGNFDKLHVFDTDGITTKLIAPDVKRVNYITWSPNGDKIAFSSEDSKSVYTINPDGTDEVTLVESNYTYMEGIYGWGLDNKIYSFTNDSIIKINQDGTERLPLVKNLLTDTYSYNKIYLNPDGSRILFTVSNLAERERAYILKMKGFGEVISIYTPSPIREENETFIEVKSISKPIKNVTIFLNNKEIGVTNDSGFLKYSFKEAGNYRLSAVKQGIKIASKSITVQERSMEQVISTATATPAVVDNTPNTSGFSLVLAVLALILIIYQIKK